MSVEIVCFFLFMFSIGVLIVCGLNKVSEESVEVVIYCIVILGFIAFMPSCYRIFHHSVSGIVECQQIKSFVLQSETLPSDSGAFFLGCGYYKSSNDAEMTYLFYKKGQVGYAPCSVDAKKVEIVETNERPPGIQGIFNDFGGIKSSENYIIFVPVGTIYETYNVDLEMENY